MARGLPDYYNPDTAVSQRVVDMHSILSVIMGMGQIDGRGRIQYYETFKEGLYGWELIRSGNGVDPAVTTSLAELPPVSVELNAGTLAGSGISQVNRYTNLRDLTSVGFEVSLNWGSRDSVVILYIKLQTPLHDYEATLTINSNTGLVTYLTGGVETPIATLGDLTAQAGWTPFKLVVDFTTGTYKRAVVGQTAYDLAGPIPDGGGTLINSQLLTTLQVNSNDTVAAYVYLGHAVITTDEP
jgi:hypothetical protein